MMDKILGAVCVLLGLALGWQTMRLSAARTDLANEQRDRKADQVAAEKAARVAVEKARTEERRVITDQQEIIDGQTKVLARARADAAAAAGSVDKLRKRDFRHRPTQ